MNLYRAVIAAPLVGFVIGLATPLVIPWFLKNTAEGSVWFLVVVVSAILVLFVWELL